MRIPPLRRLAFAALASFFIAGCGSDNPASPSTQKLAASGFTSSVLARGPMSVSGLVRSFPLLVPVTASSTIGTLGGVISLPVAGLTIVVPPLALTRPTTITVTALPGRAVAYEFGPHGTKFLVPITLIQSLRGISGVGSSLTPGKAVVGYFDNEANVNSNTGVTAVTELLSVDVNLLSLTYTFTVSHFSGYILASGRSETDPDEDP